MMVPQLWIALVLCLWPISARRDTGSRLPPVARHTRADKQTSTIAVLHDDNFATFAETKSIFLVGFYSSSACGASESSSTKCEIWLKELEVVADSLSGNRALTFALVDAASEAPVPGASAFTVPSPYTTGAAIAHKYAPMLQEDGTNVSPVLRLFRYGKFDTDATRGLPKSTSLGFAGDLISMLSLFVRPSSVPLYTVADVENAVASHRANFTIAIGFYADQRMSNVFAEVGTTFKESGVLFFHVASRDTRQGWTDPAKEAVLQHFELTGTFVIFQHQTEVEQRIFGHNHLTQQRGRPLTRDTAPAHKILSKLSPNFVIFKDKLVPGDSPLLKSDAGFFAKSGGLSKDGVVADFISYHGLSSVGLLTAKNRALYNKRTKNLVFVFLPVDDTNAEVVVPPPRSGAEGGQQEEVQRGQESKDDARDSIVIPQEAGSWSKTIKGEEYGATQDPKKAFGVGPEPRRNKGAITTREERRQTLRRVVQTVRERPLSTKEIKIVSKALGKLAQRPVFQNYSFLFVHPLDHPQIFTLFGYDLAQDVVPSPAASNAPSWEGVEERGLKPVLNPKKFPGRLTHAIGVLSGEHKYRYPHPYLAPALLEKFLGDVETEQISPYIQSQAPPLESDRNGDQNAIGMGVPVVLVHSSFQARVKEDLDTDTLVLFTNPYELRSTASSYTGVLTTATRNVAELAAQEKGNKKLLIAVYDALHNDPPSGFECEQLPCLWFVPTTLKKNVLGHLSSESSDPPCNECAKTATSPSPWEPKLYSDSAVAEGGGDYSVESILAFIELHATVPLLTNKEKKTKAQKSKKKSQSGSSSMRYVKD